MRNILFFIIGFHCCTQFVLSCTTFALQGDSGLVVGKSFDWHESHGMLVANKRNVFKIAERYHSSDDPVEWTSKYGSLTFNQHGREFPLGGINEKGLVAEIMLGPSEHIDSSDPRKSINELQWIQYVLDNFDSLPRFLSAIESIRVSKVFASVHYMVCDANGDCAAVEYLDQTIFPHLGPLLPVKAFTNDSYSRSLLKLRRYIGFGGRKRIPGGARSIARFVRTASLLQRYDPAQDVFDSASTILHSVANGGGQWQTIYKDGHLVFTEREGTAGTKKVEITKLDFHCLHPVKVLNLEAEISGEVTNQFEDYTDALNAEMISRSTLTPAEIKQMLIGYPSKTRCKEDANAATAISQKSWVVHSNS
ncbi:MAG: linear amide C-N hydrolase [Deltaproteobacteria bacterium]|nr:linear amide C-N hydrolase [Deltaproteobacteria bacterium]